MADQLSPAQTELKIMFDAIDDAYRAELPTSKNTEQLAIARIKKYAVEYAKFRQTLAQLEEPSRLPASSASPIAAKPDWQEQTKLGGADRETE